ncbi:hypothetical protein K437DRAFT_265525 [Tilletiaria anomala UBC 951]|uniref:Uncharacterized protein n=1 Tax=Tilletiaria anomala (strain ATCC 24038 / CBS 436.72 / UBC 951) TaxID=1037660 RepID=A0A066V482_TILAU|nr:uncharacterized protein K437DRAFT_265525 [Tilletiaria anomala UBC 951]KDN35048.1 hypothetical protein K437DRAFT_265525 [Tilletiaria anomala UBC 951]
MPPLLHTGCTVSNIFSGEDKCIGSQYMVIWLARSINNSDHHTLQQMIDSLNPSHASERQPVLPFGFPVRFTAEGQRHTRSVRRPWRMMSPAAVEAFGRSGTHGKQRSGSASINQHPCLTCSSNKQAIAFPQCI